MLVVRSPNAEKLSAKFAETNIIASAKFDGLRISFHVYNTLDDVRAILAALDRHWVDSAARWFRKGC